MNQQPRIFCSTPKQSMPHNDSSFETQMSQMNDSQFKNFMNAKHNVCKGQFFSYKNVFLKSKTKVGKILQNDLLSVKIWTKILL